MKVVSWIILSLIFVSCSENKEELNEEMVSTSKHLSNAKESKIRNRLNGKWRQINRNCDEEGRNCVPLTTEILWTFKKHDVVWGRFTHPFYISNDTIYIAGIPYKIALNSEDTLLFHAASTNDYMQLVRN